MLRGGFSCWFHSVTGVLAVLFVCICKDLTPLNDVARFTDYQLW